MDTSLRLIMLAHPRSGSSSLLKVLQQHPALHLLEEPFNENFTAWSTDNPNYLAQIHDTPSLDAQLDAIFATYNGLKLLDYQLPDELLLQLLHEPARHVLFLRRRNLLQTVVSLLIAVQTRLWKAWDMTQPPEAYYRDLQALDIEEIRWRIEGLRQHLEWCEAAVDARLGRPALKLVYEDLYFGSPALRAQQLSALWEWLGLAPPASERIAYYLDPAEVKLSSPEIYARIPNANEIEERCGSDATGWLFRT